MKRGMCIHYTGLQNERCELGIRYADVAPGGQTGIALRVPCFTSDPRHMTASQLKHLERRGTCVKYQEPTDEQLAEWRKAADDAFTRLALAFPAMEQAKRSGVGAELDCPTGCGGRLTIAVARSNRHTSGACTTENCLRWME